MFIGWFSNHKKRRWQWVAGVLWWGSAVLCAVGAIYLPWPLSVRESAGLLWAFTCGVQVCRAIGWMMADRHEP